MHYKYQLGSLSVEETKNVWVSVCKSDLLVTLVDGHTPKQKTRSYIIIFYYLVIFLSRVGECMESLLWWFFSVILLRVDPEVHQLCDSFFYASLSRSFLNSDFWSFYTRKRLKSLSFHDLHSSFWWQITFSVCCNFLNNNRKIILIPHSTWLEANEV